MKRGPVTRRRDSFRLVETIVLAVLWWAFFQLLTRMIETTYTFGLLQTGIPVEVASILFLFLPVGLVFFPRQVGPGWAVGLGEAVLVLNALGLVLDTRGKMLTAGLGAGLALAWWALLLWLYGRRGGREAGWRLAGGLALGSLLTMALRGLYAGNALTGFGSFWMVGWGLALVGGALLPGWLHGMFRAGAEEDQRAARPGAGWQVWAAALGWMSAVALLYFGFTSPTVITRWSGANYLLVVGLAAAALVVFLLFWWQGWLRGIAERDWLLWGWNVLFVVSLGLGLLAFQVDLPRNPAAYPILAGEGSGWGTAALYLAVALSPVIYLDAGLLAQALAASGVSLRKYGWVFGAASLYLLLLALGQVFTIVYDYIPGVGPLFRDRFWLVISAASVVMALGALAVRKAARSTAITSAAGWGAPALGAGLALVALAGSGLGAARPVNGDSGTDGLRVLAYNIQQGYDASGQKGFEEQLALIQQANPDVIGLEESDVARISGGNSDEVRYLAERLNLYAYYGPKTVTGTFGIALLSRYPIRNPRTFFMYSEGEQTAAIQAEIEQGGKTYHVLVTHLGNGGPLIQQQQVLAKLGGLENVVAMGDFNFRPDTEQYALTTEALRDAWLAAGKQALIPEGQNVARRIDHVFVSPEVEVQRAMYFGPGPSDHPALLVEVR